MSRFGSKANEPITINWSILSTEYHLEIKLPLLLRGAKYITTETSLFIIKCSTTTVKKTFFVRNSILGLVCTVYFKFLHIM